MFDGFKNRFMKKYFLFLCVLIINLASFSQSVKSRGATAYPYFIEVSQPDGSIVHLVKKGDAVLNWYETDKGERVLRNSGKWFSYAVVDSRGYMIASDTFVQSRGLSAQFSKKSTNVSKTIFFSLDQIKEKESAYFRENRNVKSLYSTNNSSSIYNVSSSNNIDRVYGSFPSIGNNKVLLILAEFTDEPHKIDPAVFSDLMNKSNYNENGALGSFRDYYLENSYGELDIETDVLKDEYGDYVWVKLPHDKAFYGANVNGNDKNPEQMVVDAVYEAMKYGLDFSVYDNDGDGDVDNLMIIHSGYGEEASGGDEAIWSHSFSLRHTDNVIDIGSVVIDDYITFPELRSNSGEKLTHIGVLAHEFGHALGLPDYYPTNNGSAYGLGDWDIMDHGSWNAYGAVPAQHNAFSKSLLGWVDIPLLQLEETPVEGYIELQDITDIKSGSAFKIETKTENDFFVIENRQQRLFNTNIPYHGLLIYHVDRTDKLIWDNNVVNNESSHERMKLLMAGGDRNDELSMPFPGINNVELIDDFSNPNLLNWNDEYSDVELSNISENNGVVSFNYNSSLTLKLNFEYGDAYITDVDFSSDKVLLTNLDTGEGNLYSLNKNGVCVISEAYRGVDYSVKYYPSSDMKEVSIASVNASLSSSKGVYVSLQTEYNGSLGIDDNELLLVLKLLSMDDVKKFVVYPNPCKDEVYIELTIKNDALLQVVDMSGRVVIEKRLTSGVLDNNVLHLLNLSALQAGIYNIVITNGDNRLCKSIIKM